MENIFWFRDNIGEGGGMGKFKIGDWGLVKGYDFEMEFCSNRILIFYGIWYYELFEEKIGIDVLVIGGKWWFRLYDIWVMGCIMLEFIIWLLYGLDGLDYFN